MAPLLGPGPAPGRDGGAAARAGGGDRLLRVAEALTNVAKHAGASVVQVEVDAEDGRPNAHAVLLPILVRRRRANG